MTPMMIGPLFLLVAAASLQNQPVPPAASPASGFQPSNAVSVRTSVRIHIISGASFGASYADKPSSGVKRTIQLVGRDGSSRPAEILEFQ